MKDTLLITGANSFLGKHLMPLLEKYYSEHKGTKLLAPSSKELDLTNQQAVLDYFKEHEPVSILHMAAVCGGIGANSKNPARFILANTAMAVNLFDAAERFDVRWFYGVGTVCMYPLNCPVPFKEDDLWNGFPEVTNFPYSQAKRTVLLMQQSFRKQYGLKGAHLIPVNMYGEEDSFDPEKSHVIPALIKKFVDAHETKAAFVDVWGTGKATREFFYAGDAARAIAQAVTTKLNYPEPINLGTGSDISIYDLAHLIGRLVGYEGEIRFNENGMDGQPRRRLDVTRAKEVMNFEAEITLEVGLRRTIDWYRKHVRGN